MKRTDHIYPRGDMYRLIPSLVKPVFPGERFESHVRGHMESDVVANLRSPAVVSHYAFYVPFRLVWSGWEQFIADADSGAAIPTVNFATSPFGPLGEGSGTGITLYRRAYKLIYNEFFGDDGFGAHAIYADPTAVAADTNELVPGPLKSVNQVLSNLALDTDEPADNYSVVASTIELTEFRRRLKANARGNNQRIGGEKYVDALRRYGVDMREELVNRPVLISRSSEVVYPQEVFNTSETGTGSRVGRYRVALDFKVKRHFCMEHGTIMIMHAMRPFLARPLAPVDRFITGRHFYMEEHEKPFREIASTAVGTATDVEPDPLIPAENWMNLGDMIAINGGTGTLGYASTAALANLIYPTVAGSPLVNMATSIVSECHR